ncbi:MAG: HPF/RaiA family ribosome-associated protein [Chitinophagaceae bacterium]|nr:HPF/RaiA family ribosome-associated protein [Chitinophagaceae bacterium]
MLIQINTDNHIEGSENLIAHFTEALQNTLKRFNEYITRLEVHLGDENGAKKGDDDKRCMLEARLKGMSPVAVTHHASTLHLAVKGAADKLITVLGNTLDQKRNH